MGFRALGFTGFEVSRFGGWVVGDLGCVGLMVLGIYGLGFWSLGVY